MTEGVPSDPHPPTGAQLRDALDAALALSMPGARIQTVRRRPAAYGSSFHLEELDVVTADGRIIEMMFKDVGQLAAPARRVKPSFLHHPEREIFVYRDVLRPAEFHTPRCYGAVVNAAEHRYWLFLERVAGVPLRESGDFDRWQQAAVWLARFHAEFTRRAAALRRHACLLVMDRDFFTTWMSRAMATVGDAAMRDELARLAPRYGAVVDKLATLPATLIHGEFYPSNIVVRETGGEVSPIDWEMAAIGPGALDLAALVTGWPDAEALKLARTYHDAGGTSIGYASLDQLLNALDYCRLHLAMQWLGWSAEWTAPPEHRHDWFRTAVALAGRLVP